MIKRLYQFFKRWDYKIKFLMVGALNTLVGVGSYWLILWLCGVNLLQNNQGLVWQIILATACSQILGLINSYFWNKFFTFESHAKSKTEIIRFVLVYAVAFGVEYLMKFVLRLNGVLNEIVITLITVLITMVISFVGQKFFVFRTEKLEPEQPCEVPA